MQIKEACDRTGLTRKTIRYYEQERLFESKKTLNNGKVFHDYSEENIQQLCRIASLRRARFSVEEIRAMLDNPTETGTVFSTWLERMEREAEAMEQLLETARQLQPEAFDSMEKLAEQLSKPVAGQELPPEDIRPRFLYLDEMEMELMEKQKNEQKEATMESAILEDGKTFRRFVASSSIDKTDDKAAWYNEMHDAFDSLRKQESVGVQDRKEKLPRVVEVIGKLGGILLGIGVAAFLLYLVCCAAGIFGGTEEGIPAAYLLVIPLVVAGIGFVMDVSVRIIAAVVNRNAWIRRMQEQDAEKAKAALEKAEKAKGEM